MMVIGFVGFHCAAAPNETSAATKASAARTADLRVMISSSPLVRRVVLTDSLTHCNAALALTTLGPGRRRRHGPSTTHHDHRRRLVPGPGLARRGAIGTGP